MSMREILDTIIIVVAVTLPIWVIFLMILWQMASWTMEDNRRKKRRDEIMRGKRRE